MGEFFTPCGLANLFLGDCVDVLDSLPSNEFDAIVTDPPYSSGAMSMGSRAADPVVKYQQGGQLKQWATFSGDNRDQRSWAFWSTMWMRRAKRLLRPGGYILTFTDWRQLPTTTDALQAAGFIWRGIVAWNKGRRARSPHKGYFRHQCEYVVWGTLGACSKALHDGPFDGCIDQQVDYGDKHHLCGKPVQLMRELLRIVPSGSRILDPFMGSASTGVAAASMGHRFTGIETDEIHFRKSVERVSAAYAGI